MRRIFITISVIISCRISKRKLYSHCNLQVIDKLNDFCEFLLEKEYPIESLDPYKPYAKHSKLQ